MKRYFKHGSWNAVCDVCGFQFKADGLKKRWDGLMVCHKDYEVDHPQKYLRVKEETNNLPFVRQETESLTTVCYIYARLAYAGLAEADCAQADNTSLPYSSAVLMKG